MVKVSARGFTGDSNLLQRQGRQSLQMERLFDEALAAHLAGRVDEAQHEYEIYLESIKSAPVVRTNLAAIYIQQGRYTDAEQLIGLALAEAPNYPEALSNRGYLYLLQGNDEQAVVYLEQALGQNPSLSPALTHLIPLYRRSGRNSEALALVERALAAVPDQPHLLEQRAQLLHGLDGAFSAVASLRQALEDCSNSSKPSLLSALARQLLYQGTDLPAALEAFDQAIAASPVLSIDNLINKGEVLRRLSRREDAVAWVNQCLMSHPHDAGLINLKACILQDLGLFQDALTLYGMALTVDPSNPQIQANRGFLLSNQGRHIEAQQSFQTGLRFNPRSAICHHGMAQASFHLGKPSTAYSHYKAAIEIEPDNLNIWDNFLYFLSFVNQVSASRYIQHCKDYADHALAPHLADSAGTCSHTYADPSSRPLRVGIISAEVGGHCVSYFLLSLVRGAVSDDAKFFIFPSKDRHSEPRWQEFLQLAEHFECIEQLSDQAACERIRSFNLDVVLETSQHMTANRLSLIARRLAPVQAHYIGMHGTTGVPAVDYFIGDNYVTPEEFSSSFTEKLLRLPRTWVCYTPPSSLPPIRITTDKLPLRLGCFNNVSKISRSCLRLWAMILLALPNSKLMIKDSLRRGELDHQNNLVDYLRRRGVHPSRIDLLPRTDSWESHMDMYNDVDIALDTLPLTSGTTAFDALLMGTPLVAYSTSWIGGRLSASIVAGFGRADWIAESDEDYVAIVKKLSKGLVTLRKARQSRRDQFLRSELCDQAGLASSLISALRLAYQRSFVSS